MLSKKYQISVIIPTYKPGSYLWDCLDTIKKQTLPLHEYEIIIVLNGCNEPYFTDINNFVLSKMKEHHVKLLKNDTAGVSAARNYALDNAEGEYICFIDDDDFVSLNYLAELLKKANTETIPVCRPLSFIDGTKDYKKYNITKDYDKYYIKGRLPFTKPKRFFNGPVYKLIHYKIIGNRRFDVRFCNGEDSLFMFLISDRIKYVDFADRSTVYYRRIRANSATQRKKSFGYAIKNYSKLMMIQTFIFVKGFPHYNFLFYCNSIIGRIKSILID